jgi:hypothetical protein
MLRLSALAIPLALFAAVAPAKAGVVTQDIPNLIQSIGDLVPFDIKALPFDSSLGALQDVTLELTGTLAPKIANDLAPFPPTATLVTHLFVFAENGGPTMSVLVDTQTVPVVSSPGSAGIATGTAVPIDQTFDFADPSAFITATAGSQLLAGYGFLTSDGLPGSGSDLTSFTGSGILTYTYADARDVPEPGTALVFGTGLLGLLAFRRRSS